MKDYIKNLAKGEFEYVIPELMPVERVSSSVVEDSSETGTFAVKATGRIQGAVFSNNPKVKVDDDFSGSENTVQYTVSATDSSPGDVIAGEFQVVTSAGEFIVPFDFEVKRKTISTKSGLVINSPESFAEFAKENPLEAGEIFLSREFRAVVLRDDLFLNALYDQMKGQEDVSIALNSFLEGAGLTELSDKSDFHSTTHQRPSGKNKISPFMKRFNRLKVELLRGYLKFRMKKETLSDWTGKALRQLSDAEFLSMCGTSEEEENAWLELQVARAMLLSLHGDSAEAGVILKDYAEKLFKNKQEDGRLFYTSLYVRTMTDRSGASVEYAVDEYKRIMKSDKVPWQIILFAYHLDPDAEENASIWLTRFKDAFAKGCTSPVIYLEAIRIINKQPALLRVLNAFETQVIRFGYRYSLVEAAATSRITELVSEETKTDMTHLYCLKNLYDEYNSDEILITLCSKMIQGNIKGPEYAGIYEQAIKRGLNITLLYEFYLMSLDRSELKRLPETVLRYFVYDSGIDANTKAYLYACVINVREKEPDIYHLYRNNILEFTKERLGEGLIDNSLIVLYRWFWDVTENFDPLLSAQLFRLQFTYRIKLESDVPITMVTRHKEFKTPKKTPVKDRLTYAFILSENGNIEEDCVICFEDAEGRMYSDRSFAYTVERVLEDRPFVQMSDSECSKDPYYLLYRYRQELQKEDRVNTEVFAKSLLMYDGISNSFESELRTVLYGSTDPGAPEAKGPEVKNLRGVSKAVSDLENSLARMLFTKRNTEEMAPVFYELYSLKQDGDVTDAYIAYQSFLYFVKEEKADDSIFPIIYNRLDNGEKQLPVELAALLKHDATGERELTAKEIDNYTNILNAFIGKGFIFPFFKELNSRIPLPYYVADKSVIELKRAPRSDIWIDLQDNSKIKRKVRPMETVGGVYIYPVTLFEGDSLSYRISITDEYGNTESSDGILEYDGRREYENKEYQMINDLLRAGDNALREEAINDYYRESNLNEALFITV